MTDDEARGLLRQIQQNYALRSAGGLTSFERSMLDALTRALGWHSERDEARSKVHAQRREIRRLRALCGDDRAPDAHRGGAHSDPATAEIRAAMERVEALPRYDLDGGTGYSMHALMERSADGEYFEVDGVLAALREIRRGDG